MKPAPNFDRLARHYRWMELVTFGPWLCWARCAFLGRLCACRRALVLGDGDGRFSARLLQANSAVRIDAVDASRAMLASLARRAGPRAARVRTHCADVRLWQPNGPEDLPYDLIATHFFLDCLTTREVQSLAEKLRGAVSPSAVWVVSEFAVPPGWFGRLVASPLIFALYRAFGWLTGLAVRTLPDHATALGQAGFTLKERRAWLAGLLVSERWSAGAAPNAAGTTAKQLESPVEMLQSC
jgi:SAM-dependent methyltransferase